MGGLLVLEGVLVLIPSLVRGAGGQGKGVMELGAHSSQGCWWRKEWLSFLRVWVMEMGFVLGKIRSA